MTKHEQILAMLDAGKTHAEICTTLHCSMSTIQKVKLQRENLFFEKMKKNREESGIIESEITTPVTTPATTTSATTKRDELQVMRIRRYLTRSLAGCKKATGLIAAELMLWLEARL